MCVIADLAILHINYGITAQLEPIKIPKNSSIYTQVLTVYVQKMKVFGDIVL